MNGEVPNVPITTLAGITSLTDLLPELPLPTPLPNAINNKSLLHNSKLSEKSRKLLEDADDALVEQISEILRQSTTDDIELKDNLEGAPVDGEMSELLRAILANDPEVFSGGSKERSRRSSGRSSHSGNQSPYQSHSPRIGLPTGTGSSSVQKSPSLPHQQPGSSNYNGEHFDKRNKHKLPTAVMSSPAQATVAESAMRQTTGRHSGVIDLDDDSDGGSIQMSRSNKKEYDRKKVAKCRGKRNKATVMKKSEEKLRNEFLVEKMKASGKPVVCLEPLGSKMDSMFDLAKQKDDIWNTKCKPVRVSLEPLDERTLKSIATGGTVKTKGMKRHHGDHYDNDYGSDRGKRRRRSGRIEEESEESDHDSVEELMRRKKKEKRQRRMNQTDMSIEELLDSPTFKKFSSALEYIFDSAEDVNFGSLDPNDEDVECPPESLISRTVLSELTSETAKLKSMGVLNQVPANTLVKLLTILQWNIRDGTKLLPSLNQEHDDEDEEGQKLWREIAMERVGRSIDAALTAIYIMTSPKMPKQVFIEDVIDRIVMFGKFQLQNTIYPEFDPVYRINPKDKDGYHSSSKMKRSRASQVKHKSSVSLYNKLTDLVGNLAELVEIQELTDTIILQISTLGVAPFFVENVSELQLNAMKLVTTVFAHYDKHRQLVLEDIFSSLARLPSSKRNLRSYRLNAGEHIQMVTALALQLIQCVVKLPQPKSQEQPTEEEQIEEAAKSKRDKHGRNKRKSDPLDPDVVIVTSYETAIRTGYNFLSVFLKKCTVKGEEDYRSLFENFVHDLLSTVNKPEWPASELLLSLLGRILVQQFSNKSIEMSLRTSALEYLGIVAARLRKDAVSSQLGQEIIDDIVTKVNHESDKEDEDDVRRSTRSGRKSPEEEVIEPDETQSLQKAMLDYLSYHGASEPAYLFARQFYIAQWFRDTTKEAEKKNKKADEDFDAAQEEKSTENMTDTEARTKFLLSQVEISYKPYSSYKPMPSKLDYDNGCLVARYLSSKRPFAQSFDIYLGQILKVLAENAVAIRTKAMKCLTSVVEADPGVLARPDMERGVHGRFLDPSTSVREAAIELVGKFILIRPELIPQYYNMLSERILDTGISVRKRVIKIFRDIFNEKPDFNKIPDMCVKMIRRVNDEDGIKKLVNEVFQTMWFTPLSSREKDSTKLIQRVVNITEVVAASKDTGFEFIEQLLDNLLKKDEHGNYNKSALTSCRQIVDCLVENVLRLEETSVDGKCSNRLSACLSTLYLFSKIKPDLMLEHAQTLQPYLNIKCSNQGDFYVLHYVARILELVIPLMDHPSENFLAQVEEDMIKLILNHGMMVLESCVSCLGAVVNNVSHNYPLVKDCFQKFFGYLVKFQSYHQGHPTVPLQGNRKPTLLRSLFTVGLMCKHFNFESKELGDDTETSLKEKIFDVLVYYTTHVDEDVQSKALTGLGFLAVRHYEYMLGRTLKTMYSEHLTNPDTPIKLKCQVLKNLYYYLVEEEVRMAKSDADWKKHAKEEDLKEMGDVQSGMASTIMQVYLKEVLEVFFSSKSQVRLEALNVIQLVLKQGLIHPVQCVPYLISMATDSEAPIRVKAEQQLQEIEKKYPGFIHSKALQGIKMCFRLHRLIQGTESNNIVVRGLHNPDDNSSSLNAFLYNILRTNRSHRRAILTSLLNLLDDSARINLPEQLYIADNLAFFLYQTQDEPLYIIHQIDIIVSVSGSNLLQSFREKLQFKDNRSRKMKKKESSAPVRRSTRSSKMLSNPHATENGVVNDKPNMYYDEDDDDKDILLNRLPGDIAPLKEIIWIAQGCILLLYLKQHLKDMYGFTDGKIQNYSPTEAAKVYDKPLQRKSLVKFNPEQVIHVLRNKENDEEKSQKEQADQLVDDYLAFKDLMLSVDPPDEDDSDTEQRAAQPSATTTYTIKSRPEDGGGDAGTTNHMENGDHSKNNADVIMVDGDNGDADHVNLDKESPSEPMKPKIPPMIISTSKINTPHREKEKKKGSLVRTIRLPGASQLQASAHNFTSPVHSHSSHHSSHHSSSSSSRSHHHKTPSSTHKKKKKKRKRYTSDSDDDNDSDYDPYG
ncbi:nipped-B-like protein isoform X2 [Mercenaria mercenaria]|uniref:nipped-B-like protein isoform X2 n=1 Tax=Mercenaria mercenaria TaxID=6596 RepID=UPI00234F23BA|nr:nipped-B-like protein isoform X2 [Mercenaria mercenaria]